MFRHTDCEQHITLHSLITIHHANMRCSSSMICVPKSFCYPRVMSRSLPHLTLATSTSSLSLSHLPLRSCSRLLLHTQACCLTIHTYTATVQGGVAVPRISNLPQVRSPKGSSSTGILRLNIKIKRMNLEKLVLSRCPTTSH